MTSPEILSLVLAFCAVIGAFMPRVPSAIVAYLSLLPLVAHTVPGQSRTLIFWGIAAAIASVIQYWGGRQRAGTGRWYVVCGALIGVLLGYLLSPTQGMVIVGSAFGALLGGVAYLRTPQSRRLGEGAADFASFIAWLGLPAVVTFSVCAISLSSILL